MCKNIFISSIRLLVDAREHIEKNTDAHTKIRCVLSRPRYRLCPSLRTSVLFGGEVHAKDTL